MYPQTIRPLIFRLDPERAHDLTLKALQLGGRVPLFRKLMQSVYSAHSHSDQSVNAFGLKFPNPVGLAAGYDKDGLAWTGLSALGFGHIEIGTVTPRPQIGDPKPRIFRIPAEQGVINRMGFPGRGAEYVANHLYQSRQKPNSVILGVNIGKNKDTPNEEAARDYVFLLKAFSPIADYLTVNISSPNTVGLRRLQGREYLEGLLNQLQAASAKLDSRIPILVKIAPDLKDEELDDALDAILRSNMDGIVATNTTIDRKNLKSPVGREAGGLSGAPLTLKSREMVSKIFQRTGGKLPIVGVGGIMTKDDAKAMLNAGAVLIQVYSGLIYAGPGFVGDILESM